MRKSILTLCIVIAMLITIVPAASAAPLSAPDSAPQRQAGLACLVIGGPLAGVACEIVWTGVKWVVVAGGVALGTLVVYKAGEHVVGKNRVRACTGPCTATTVRPKCPGGFEHLCKWDPDNPGRTCQRINAGRASLSVGMDRCFKGNAGQIGILLLNGVFFISNGFSSTFIPDNVPPNFTEMGKSACKSAMTVKNTWAYAARKVVGCN